MAKKAASKKRKTTKKKVNKSKKRKTTKKRRTTRIRYESVKEIKVERALVENFVGLQKVMVGLSAKFDNLAHQISKLLELFEISAKALARKEFGIEGSKDSKKIMEKLDNLSEKAGLIGKGLALIHESGQGLPPQHKTGEIPEQREMTQIRRPPMAPGTPMAQRTPQKTALKSPEMSGYQKSITSTSEHKKTREVSEEEHDQTNF